MQNKITIGGAECGCVMCRLAGERTGRCGVAWTFPRQRDAKGKALDITQPGRCGL